MVPPDPISRVAPFSLGFSKDMRRITGPVDFLHSSMPGLQYALEDRPRNMIGDYEASVTYMQRYRSL
jgi:hypothetical protein